MAATSDAALSKEIDARYRQSVEYFNSKDVDKIVGFYTETATIMHQDQEAIVGRKAIRDMVKTSGDVITEIEFERLVYCERMSETTAYSNGYCTVVTRTGDRIPSQDGILWRKVDGEWLADREIVNNRPKTQTPSEAAKTRIQQKIAALYVGFNTDDYDAVMDIYVDGASVVPHEGDITTGKQAIRAMFEEVMPAMKTLVVEELYYFELLNDNTAYTNSHGKIVDDSGNTKAKIRDALLWTKVDGDWYIKRDMFNDRPLPKV